MSNTTMTDTEKLQFLLTQLQETAAREHCEDAGYYCTSDNGNYDDTFADGTDYGEVEYARLLLAKLAKQG
jgi:hypothetical protein